MTTTRTQQQTAFDGVRFAWCATEDSAPQIPSMSATLSIDGVVRMRRASTESTNLQVRAPIPNGVSMAKQVAPVMQSFKKALRSIDGIRIPNMGY